MFHTEDLTPVKMILDHARRCGVEAEVMMTESRSISVGAFGGVIDKQNVTQSHVFGIRVITPEETEGYAYSERFDFTAFKEAFSEAWKNAGICRPSFPVTLANPPPAESKQNFFHPELAQITPEQWAERALSLESKTYAADSRIKNVIHAACGYSESTVCLANTRGLFVQDHANSVYASSYALAEENEQKKTGGYARSASTTAEIDPAEIAQEAARDATRLLGAVPLKQNRAFPVLFTPEMTAELFTAFGSLFNAKSVLEKRSLLADKIGRSIGSRIWSLLNDPLLPDGPSSKNFDAEGFPAHQTLLVEHGILKNFLHNSLTAKELNLPHNANASRGPKSPLGIGRSNWILKLHEVAPLETLRKREKSVIEIHTMQGLHAGLNTTTGEFSLMAEGLLYDNGGAPVPLEPFTVSGNILDVFAGITCGGNDAIMTSNDMMTPSVYIAALSISG